MSSEKSSWVSQRTALDWVGIATIVVGLIFASVISGVGGFLIMAGTIGLGLGIYIAITGRRTMFGLRSCRKLGFAVVGGSLIAAMAGGGVYGATDASVAEPAPTVTVVETVTETVTETVHETVRETVIITPTPTPEPVEEVVVEESTPSGSGGTSGSSESGSSGSGSSGGGFYDDNTNYEPQPLVNDPAPQSAYYKNCTAAREAGVTPIYKGDPGYRPALDRDGDGIACE